MQAHNQKDAYTWKRIVTFGSEGTEAGNFCRPWGIAIMRFSDSSTLNDYWTCNVLDDFIQTSALTPTSADKFCLLNDDWQIGLKLADNLFGDQFNHAINNNNTHVIQGNQFYLIGVADRSNNRIQLFKFDSLRKTVSFVLMFGDGPGARHGQFDRPAGLVFNPKQEQIIVADKDNHRVQVFNLSGEFLFKFGERGNKCGQFCYPWDIDVCKTTQNIVVSDTRNRRVQIFSSIGRYVAHFNQPLDSPRGVAFLESSELIVSDFNKHRLLLIYSGSDRIVSSSNLPINDINNQQFINLSNRSRTITRQSSVAQSYESKHVGFGEGSSWGEFLRPQGLASDGQTVFCADSRNNRIACWDKEKQTFSYISREVVDMDRPAGLASIDNYILIVDFGNNRVHICQRQPSINCPNDMQAHDQKDAYTWKRIVTFGSEGTEAGNFCRPWGIAIMRFSDSSSLNDDWTYDNVQDDFIQTSALTPTSTNKFCLLNDDWQIGLRLADNILGHQFNHAINNNNTNVIQGNQFYLIGVADRSNNRIQLFKFDSLRKTVSFVLMFGDGPGARHGQFDRPAGLVFNPKQEQIIVADKDNHRVQVFNLSGEFLFKFGERGNKCGQFCYPWDIDVCKTTQNIVVSDTRNRRVQIFSSIGRYVAHFNQPLDSPRGVAFLESSELIVSDFNKHRLLLIYSGSDRVTSSTTLPINDSNNQQFINLSGSSSSESRQSSVAQSYESKHVGFGEGSSWGEFLRPQGVASDGQTVFCADSRNNRIACWDKERQTFSYISREVVDLDRPAGLASIDNYIVIVDFGNNRVHICQS